MPTLLEAFKETQYKLPGHVNRDVQVLKTAFETVDGHLESDMYGTGQIIEEFQKKMATYLGKEEAVFFPSGTMAQQIALRIWSDKRGSKKVAYHPLSHLEIHEENGLKELHQIESVLLANKDRVIELDDVRQMADDVSCLLLELPQREIGGQLPDYKTLQDISAFCREKGVWLHLDGARLYEILPYYKVSADEICSLFDSVYVSFYKGIGGIAGAILAGGNDFVKESKVWKRRYGGDLISLYPYILAADFYFEQRKDKMERYFKEARELAALYNQCSGVATKPLEPVSNMFHVHFDRSKEEMESILVNIYMKTGIGLSSYIREVNDHTSYYEVSIGDRYADVPKDKLNIAFNVLSEKMEG